MVVELKDKLENRDCGDGEAGRASSPAGIEADVVSALVNLGYDGRAAEARSPEIAKARSGRWKF